jgi:hypothetical protein
MLLFNSARSAVLVATDGDVALQRRHNADFAHSAHVKDDLALNRPAGRAETPRSDRRRDPFLFAEANRARCVHRIVHVSVEQCLDRILLTLPPRQNKWVGPRSRLLVVQPN